MVILLSPRICIVNLKNCTQLSYNIFLKLNKENLDSVANLNQSKKIYARDNGVFRFIPR